MKYSSIGNSLLILGSLITNIYEKYRKELQEFSEFLHFNNILKCSNIKYKRRWA